MLLIGFAFERLCRTGHHTPKRFLIFEHTLDVDRRVDQRSCGQLQYHFTLCLTVFYSEHGRGYGPATCGRVSWDLVYSG